MSAIQHEPAKPVAPPRPISVTFQVTLTALAIPEVVGGYCRRTSAGGPMRRPGTKKKPLVAEGL